MQRSRRNTERRDYATLAGVASSTPAVNQELIDAQEDTRRVVHEKAIAHNDARIARADFQEAYSTTFEDFKNLGIETARPMITKYKSLFLHPKEDYFDIVAAYRAARVLNPLVAAEMDNVQMRDAIKDLELFGFDEFRPNNGILKDLRAEIPVYCAVIAATEESFWSQVEGAAEYDAALEKKAEKDPAQYGGKLGVRTALNRHVGSRSGGMPSTPS